MGYAVTGSDPAKNIWSDKRWLWLLSPAILAAFAGSPLAFAWSGTWWCLLFAPVFIHLQMPLLDLAIILFANNIVRRTRPS